MGNIENIEILYEDKDITVCVKPPLVLSQQDEKGSVCMLDLLKAQMGTEHKAVHRLDFGVGGVMVYAKNSISSARLSESIRNRSFEKEYLAVVYGKPDKEGVFKDLLFKDSKKNKSYVVDRMRKGVKEASLEYRTYDTKETEKGVMSLVWIKLHTGRTHQIRVQFASRKYALYGDGKYGSRISDKKTALWSHRISFNHPITKKPMSFSCMPENVYPWNVFGNPYLQY